MPEPRRSTLAAALASVALSWIPLVGLLAAAGAVALSVRDRRRGLPSSLGIAAFGAILSVGFSAAFVACAPSGPSPAGRPSWEAFDRLFAPDGGPPAGQRQENPEDAGTRGRPGP